MFIRSLVLSIWVEQIIIFGNHITQITDHISSQVNLTDTCKTTTMRKPTLLSNYMLRDLRNVSWEIHTAQNVKCSSFQKGIFYNSDDVFPPICLYLIFVSYEYVSLLKCNNKNPEKTDHSFADKSHMSYIYRVDDHLIN